MKSLKNLLLSGLVAGTSLVYSNKADTHDYCVPLCQPAPLIYCQPAPLIYCQPAPVISKPNCSGRYLGPRGLAREIMGTKWNEVSETISKSLVDKGIKSDDSKDDYIIFTEGLRFEFRDGNNKAGWGRIDGYILYQNDPERLDITVGNYNYILKFNKDRSKMSLNTGKKTINYERETVDVTPKKSLEKKDKEKKKNILPAPAPPAEEPAPMPEIEAPKPRLEGPKITILKTKVYGNKFYSNRRL